ncbi:MAG: PAS domain S-box protein, partial [Calditrichaeota bacterium]|nr:PAS domain S-box protein [Calditrichota bacterium]
EADVPQIVAAMKAGASDVILSAELSERLLAVLKNAIKTTVFKNDDDVTTENEVIRELERKTYSLAMGNIAMLEMQEKLEAKNAELNSVLRDYSRSRENLQAILDISPTAIIMVNESDKIIAYNKRVLQYFGIKNESVDNCRFDDFLNTIAPTFNHFDAFKKTIEQPDQMLKPEEFAQLARLSDFQRHVFSLSHPVTRMIVPFLTYPEPFGEGKRCRIYTFMDVTELRQANAMLHAIVDASPLPFIVSRLSDGEILYANKPLADLVGREPHEAIGMKTLNFYANESDRIDVVRKIQENKQLQNHEVLIRKADGSSAWMSFSLVVTELDGEEVIIGGLYDIDVRRRAEEALIESEERFRQLTENIREVFWIHDVKSGKPLYLSPAYESITGLDRNAMTEHLGALLNIIHPDDRLRINTAMQKQITGEFDEEYRIIKPNGEVRWIRERAFPIHNEDGEVVRICGVSEDFTERKSVENALRQSEEALRTIFNASYDAIIIHDEFGKVIDVN